MTTKTETKPITAAQVRTALRDLIKNKPDTVNPMRVDDDICAYHRGRGANIRRCIAGQIGYDFGLPTPKANADGVIMLTADTEDQGEDQGIWANRFTPRARQLLHGAQLEADGYGRGPAPWGSLTLAGIEKAAEKVDITLYGGC